MKIDQQESVSQEQVDSILSSVIADKTKYFVPISNAKVVKDFLTENRLSTKNSFLVEYKKGEEIVHSGLVVKKELKENDFSYASVPLGLILAGEVIVIKDGKATKHLGTGDFIGLFETSDWLSTGQTRHIGDWTLVANENTKILFVSRSLLKTDGDFSSYLVELARHDPVPQPISSLPLLDWVASHTTEERLIDTIVIAHTHLLPNNLPLFRHLAHLVRFGQMYVVEKPYSTVPFAYKELIRSEVEVISVKIEKGVPYEFSVQKSLEVLWRRIISERKNGGFKNVLILDDGADIWLSIPWTQLDGISIAGVEQTQRGITRIKNSNLKLPPIISVATSGIKKLIESKFIGHSIVKKLNNLGFINKSKTIGILGMGSIGESVLNSLKELGKDAIFYDSSFHTNPSSSDNARNALDTLLNESDLVIGTTGTDALKGVTLDRVNGHKILASASSADIEFASILKLGKWSDDSFNPISVPIHDNLTMEVLNGGYPINFDREGNATSDEDIVLTRCLLYIGAMQAAKLLSSMSKESGIYNLDGKSQEMLLTKWIEEKVEAGKDIDIARQDIEEIINFGSLEEGRNMPSIWKD